VINVASTHFDAKFDPARLNNGHEIGVSILATPITNIKRYLSSRRVDKRAGSNFASKCVEATLITEVAVLSDVP